MRGKATRHLWIVIAAYGVWFAVFSGIEEVMRGKWQKAALSTVLALVVYVTLELKKEN